MQDRQREVGGIQLFQTGQDDIKRAEATVPALRTAAIRRLRALIEPQLQGQPEGISITKLGELEHEALATVFLAEATQESVSILTQPVPDVVSDTGKCILGGGVAGTSSQPLFSVAFFMPTPNGKLQMNGMSGGVDYIK